MTAPNNTIQPNELCLAVQKALPKNAKNGTVDLHVYFHILTLQQYKDYRDYESEAQLSDYLIAEVVIKDLQKVGEAETRKNKLEFLFMSEKHEIYKQSIINLLCDIKTTDDIGLLYKIQ